MLTESLCHSSKYAPLYVSIPTYCLLCLWSNFEYFFFVSWNPCLIRSKWEESVKSIGFQLVDTKNKLLVVPCQLRKISTSDDIPELVHVKFVYINQMRVRGVTYGQLLRSPASNTASIMYSLCFCLEVSFAGTILPYCPDVHYKCFNTRQRLETSFKRFFFLNLTQPCNAVVDQFHSPSN